MIDPIELCRRVLVEVRPAILRIAGGDREHAKALMLSLRELLGASGGSVTELAANLREEEADVAVSFLAEALRQSTLEDVRAQRDAAGGLHVFHRVPNGPMTTDRLREVVQRLAVAVRELPEVPDLPKAHRAWEKRLNQRLAWEHELDKKQSGQERKAGTYIAVMVEMLAQLEPLEQRGLGSCLCAELLREEWSVEDIRQAAKRFRTSARKSYRPTPRNPLELRDTFHFSRTSVVIATRDGHRLEFEGTNARVQVDSKLP